MFTKTRIKLTSWYLFILFIITALFSMGLYRLSSIELDRIERINTQRMQHWMEMGLPIPQEKRLRNLLPFQDPELIEETKQRIAKQLGLINIAILLIAGGAAYMLAGKTLKPIEDMVLEQKRFISDASHELKTPLTGLKTSLEVYLRDPKSTKKEADTLIMESLEDVNKLQSLTEHLLTQAILDQQSVLAFSVVDLSLLLQETIKRLQPVIDRKKLTIETKLLSGNISGNSDMLERLFTLLLDNAIKYSEEYKTVVVEMKKTNKTIAVSCIDQGKGIEKKHLPFIFERFYRADDSREKKKTDGFGLGLSIAKKIADTHHATLTVKSTPGKGSTFTVTFPNA